MSPSKTKEWVLANPPTAMPILDGDNATFKLVTSELPTLKDDQVLLKNLYFSNDPAQRGLIAATIDPKRHYIPTVAKDTPMRAQAVAEVIESRSDQIEQGSQVLVFGYWSEYIVVDAKECQTLQQIPGLSSTHYLGWL